jgi:menaquinone-dependent protoporphyrinogen oxidase
VKIVLALMMLFAAQSAIAKDGAMKNVLMVHGSFAGSTVEIAERLAAGLRTNGCIAAAAPATDKAVDLAGYDLVVIGAAIRGGRPHPAVGRFIEANRVALGSKQVAVFAVCITIASTMESKRKAARVYPDLVANGAPPVSKVVFAGNAPSSGWFGNTMGKPTLGIAPGDYRDWPKIDAWARSLAELPR